MDVLCAVDKRDRRLSTYVVLFLWMNQWTSPAFPLPVQFAYLFSLPEHDHGFTVRNVPKRMRAVMEQGKNDPNHRPLWPKHGLVTLLTQATQHSRLLAYEES